MKQAFPDCKDWLTIFSNVRGGQLSLHHLMERLAYRQPLELFSIWLCLLNDSALVTCCPKLLQASQESLLRACACQERVQKDSGGRAARIEDWDSGP